METRWVTPAGQTKVLDGSSRYHTTLLDFHIHFHNTSVPHLDHQPLSTRGD